MTRALVIGAGSIGLRHAVVLQELGIEVAFVTARTDLPEPSFGSVDLAVAEFAPSYVVIATETSEHERAVARLASTGFSETLMVEKPLAVRPDVFGPARFQRVGVGFNLRFHPVLDALRRELVTAKVATIESYAGQHLTSWRPDRPVHEQYSSSRARGGGVLRDLSHELDALGWMLGSCAGVFARGGRVTDLTVDADDAWGMVAEYERCPVVTLQVNYLDSRPRRRIIANTDRGTFEADLIAGTLTTAEATIAFDVERNATYRAMHVAMLSEDGRDVATVADAVAVDQLIDAIEHSAGVKEWVQP
ncbi:hypothetical protein ASE14_05400 [Agromyces sp. Root81]|uniref:Gfo/Idh/MocA family protein n=1 Tax=Agromyces sp. Root81 TaxID=1736601 RepID=UPI0006F8CDF3|nr:hypothetical protein [Agromyces sp. Root81]KRC60458.1 hypothetical protein ASE14_05400 [Agromyces sp. Root81]